MATDIAVRLYDYTHTEWRELAHRNAPNWCEDDLDASWDRHIQFPVRTAEVLHICVPWQDSNQPDPSA
jgi:hypothetical protein